MVVVSKSIKLWASCLSCHSFFCVEGVYWFLLHGEERCLAGRLGPKLDGGEHCVIFCPFVSFPIENWRSKVDRVKNLARQRPPVAGVHGRALAVDGGGLRVDVLAGLP